MERTPKGVWRSNQEYFKGHLISLTWVQQLQVIFKKQFVFIKCIIRFIALQSISISPCFKRSKKSEIGTNISVNEFLNNRGCWLEGKRRNSRTELKIQNLIKWYSPTILLYKMAFWNFFVLKNKATQSNCFFPKMLALNVSYSCLNRKCKGTLHMPELFLKSSLNLAREGKKKNIIFLYEYFLEQLFVYKFFFFMRMCAYMLSTCSTCSFVNKHFQYSL